MEKKKFEPKFLTKPTKETLHLLRNPTTAKFGIVNYLNSEKIKNWRDNNNFRCVTFQTITSKKVSTGYLNSYRHNYYLIPKNQQLTIVGQGKERQLKTENLTPLFEILISREVKFEER